MNKYSVNEKAENIRDVIRYLQKFKNAVVVIYLNEKTIESPLFSSHIRDIALLHEAGLKVVIVPGARKRIDEVLESSNIEWHYEDGIRVTNVDAMPSIKMAAFDVSNIVMTSLAANGINAIIGNWVIARSKGVINGMDFGTAGEINKLQITAIQKILDDGFIPIFPCIGWNSVGHPYNISSTVLAQQVAIQLKSDKLFFVLDSESIDNSLYEIPAMNIEQVDNFLKEKKNQNSISLKILELSREACKNGVSRAHIVDGNIDGVLPCEIFSDLGSGTMIYTSNYGKIRSMLQTDIPAVLGIMAPFVESGKLLQRTESDLFKNLDKYIVYEVDGGVHACSCLICYEDGQCEIAAVAVDEKFAHMGIGPELIKFQIEKAKSLNSTGIFIMTTQAADWFEKMGFVLDEINSLPESRKKIWTKKRNSKVYRLK